MKSNLRILALCKEEFTEVTITGLTPIGGKNSTGLIIGGLKHEGDYAILMSDENTLSVHTLRGSKSRPVVMRVGQIYTIDDLTLLVEEPKTVEKLSEGSQIEKLSSVLLGMTIEKNTKEPLKEILKSVISLCHHKHGLVISQNAVGTYEVIASENLDPSGAWLSENLVQQAIQSKTPVILENIIGSGYDTRQSLVATKFLSVFCWPLVVQGVVVGALVTGSQSPYSGAYESIQSQAQVYINLAALILDFHLREQSLKLELQEYKSTSKDSPFLTESPAVSEVCDLARKIANSDLSTLVQGETGVGKEVLSRWIHQQSDRKNGPFVAVNCAAIPAELLESTLFGHKRGSFTGAVSDHIGKIQQAHQGTLFLDEIADLPLSLQSKLLRVLQDNIVEPVGSNKAVDVDIRLICASHKNISKMTEENSFRQDLYYRIAQITLAIPPLRERLGDVRLLAQQFLKEINPNKRLTQDAWVWLMTQSWAGNVRELKTAVKRAAILSVGDDVLAKHFHTGSGVVAGGPVWLGGDSLESAKHVFVMKKIEQALQITNGNRTRAAELLGITSRTLFRYLE